MKKKKYVKEYIYIGIILILFMAWFFVNVKKSPLQLEESAQVFLKEMKYDKCHVTKMKKLKDVQKQKVNVKVTNQEIEQYVLNCLEENAYRVKVENRDKVANGDLAIVDYELIEGDTTITSVKDAPVRVGSGQYDKYLENAIMGATIGEKFKTIWKVPEEVNNDLSGKNIEIQIIVKEIFTVKTPTLQEYIDKFEYQDADLYRQHISNIIYEMKKEVEIKNAIEEVISELIKDSKFRMEEDAVVNNAIKWYQEYLGEQELDYKNNINVMVENEEKSIYLRSYTSSMKEIQRYLIIGRYAKEKEISVQENDIQTYLKDNEVDKSEIEDKDYVYIKFQILEDKVLKDILKNYISVE